MVPLIEKSVKTLAEIFEEKANTGESFEILQFVLFLSPVAMSFNYVFFRLYKTFIMEIIFAVAYGRVIELQKGESDSLIVATNDIIDYILKNKSFKLLPLMFSEFLCYSYI